MNDFQEKLQVMQDSMNNINQQIEEPLDNVDDSENIEDSGTTVNTGRRRKIKDRVRKLHATLQENNAVLNAQNQQLVARLQEQEARLAEAQARAEQISHNNEIYYEDSLDSERQRLLTEMKLAKENGDIDREVELTQHLSDNAAKKQTQKLHQTLQRQQQWQQPQVANYPEFPQQQMAPPPTVREYVNEHYEDWLEENSYADPDSPYYDPELRDRAEHIAKITNQSLNVNGAAHIIGTPEYFKLITNGMKEIYGGNMDDDNYPGREVSQIGYNNHPVNQQNYNYPIAPVTKKGSSMAENYVATRYNSSPKNSRPGSTLSQQEVNQAVKFANVFSEIHGRHISPEEAIKMYEKRKLERTTSQW